jgi:hypothetical protein
VLPATARAPPSGVGDYEGEVRGQPQVGTTQ